MQVQVKDTIRSYDFKPMLGREDCYVEGVVLERNAIKECGYNAYKICVTKDVFDGKALTEGRSTSRVGAVVFVPWKVSFMEYQGRIINLSR